jgi:acetyl esterase/lipase
LVLFLHGGGFVVGHPSHHIPTYRRLVETLGVTVAAAAYRRAPEHPFPAALDDVHAAWTWLVEHAEELGISRDRIVLCGESAGGGLAACLVQRLCDERGAVPCGQALIYPMLDDRTAIQADKTAVKHLVWNNGSNHYGWSSYLGAVGGAPPPYAVAARREDLSGLPPAWMTVGTLDLFFEEDQAYADRLTAAGVPVERVVVEGGFHGYFALGTDESSIVDVWTSLETFLRRCFTHSA